MNLWIIVWNTYGSPGVVPIWGKHHPNIKIYTVYHGLKIIRLITCFDSLQENYTRNHRTVKPLRDSRIILRKGNKSEWDTRFMSLLFLWETLPKFEVNFGKIFTQRTTNLSVKLCRSFRGTLKIRRPSDLSGQGDTDVLHFHSPSESGKIKGENEKESVKGYKTISETWKKIFIGTLNR